MGLETLAIVIGITGFTAIGAWYLWKRGRLDFLFERLGMAGIEKKPNYGLEFITLPNYEEMGKREIELVSFQDKGGLELLTPPPLSEITKKKEKTLSIKPRATLFTGRNLTGYFLLLTKLIMLLNKKPAFLVIKEKDIDQFSQYSNGVISVFKQKSSLPEEIKDLQYKYLKGLINEQEFKKKMSELQLQMEKKPLTSRLYENYQYFSSPSEILRDLGWFLLKTSGKGIVVMTMVDEMVQENPKKARVFIENLLKACANHSTPVILTLEQGFFSEQTNSTIRSYCNMIFETTIEGGRRTVTVFSLEKVHPPTMVSEAIANYEAFLKKVGFLEEK
ncbi:MAG: hypothetical protein QXK06_03315 [Candidatus Diapherotrites archaeon]